MSELDYVTVSGFMTLARESTAWFGERYPRLVEALVYHDFGLQALEGFFQVVPSFREPGFRRYDDVDVEAPPVTPPRGQDGSSAQRVGGLFLFRSSQAVGQRVPGREPERPRGFGQRHFRKELSFRRMLM